MFVPFLLLVGLGLYYLRQDRALVEYQTRVRTRALLVEVAKRVEEVLSPPQWMATARMVPPETDPDVDVPETWCAKNDPVHLATGSAPPVQLFVVDGDSRLIHPPPLRAERLSDATRTGTLSDLQRESWERALALEFTDESMEAALSAYAKFIETNPPEEYECRALYNKATLEARVGHTESALMDYQKLARKPARITTETGLPLPHLARFQTTRILLTQNPPPPPDISFTEVDHACRDWVYRPTRWTGIFLSRIGALTSNANSPDVVAAVESWSEVWQAHQGSRKLYTAVASETPTKTDTWWRFKLENEAWFLTSSPTDDSETRIYRVIRAGDLARSITDALSSPTPSDIPLADKYSLPGIDFNILLDGVAVHGGQPSGATPLASHMSRETSSLVIRAVHSNPETLYRESRQRLVWFGGLMGLSALTVIAGFAAIRRALIHQWHLNQQQSNFVSSVSHELRAPIASVRLMTESLQRGKVTHPGQQKNYFRLILLECVRLGTLIENVLDFSQVEKGRKVYQFEPVDIPAVITGAVDLMRPQAASRNIILRVVTSGSSDSLTANVDRHSIQQALVNLLDNAIKFSSAGSTVTIGCQPPPIPPVSNAPPQIQIRITDEGPGIPADESERIFERFYRIGSELRRETPGTGIGLCIVAHIVEAHRGTIRVEPAAPHGSTFILTLPHIQPDNR